MPTIEVAGIKINYETIAEVPSAIQKEISERGARLTRLDKDRQKLKAEIRKLRSALGGKSQTSAASAHKQPAAVA